MNLVNLSRNSINRFFSLFKEWRTNLPVPVCTRLRMKHMEFVWYSYEQDLVSWWISAHFSLAILQESKTVFSMEWKNIDPHQTFLPSSLSVFFQNLHRFLFFFTIPSFARFQTHPSIYTTLDHPPRPSCFSMETAFFGLYDFFSFSNQRSISVAQEF